MRGSKTKHHLIQVVVHTKKKRQVKRVYSIQTKYKQLKEQTTNYGNDVRNCTTTKKIMAPHFSPTFLFSVWQLWSKVKTLTVIFSPTLALHCDTLSSLLAALLLRGLLKSLNSSAVSTSWCSYSFIENNNRNENDPLSSKHSFTLISSFSNASSRTPRECYTRAKTSKSKHTHLLEKVD